MLGVEFKKKGDVIRDVTILTLKAKSNATLLNQIVGKVNHHVSTGSTAALKCKSHRQINQRKNIRKITMADKKYINNYILEIKAKLQKLKKKHFKRIFQKSI